MNITELVGLIEEVKDSITTECRAYEGDDEPGILLTIATNGKSWAWQTGSTQYHGPCYGYPYWTSEAIYKNSDPEELAYALKDTLDDATYS